MYARYALIVSGGLTSIVLIVLVFSIDSGSGFAQSMQSASYQIEFDSINVGGGRGESDSYIIEDTTGEIASGPSDSASYQIRAGYQQMNETYLALTSADSVALLPSLPGITGGVASGTTSVVAVTDSRAGYQLTIQASTSPALVHLTESTAFPDYEPAGAFPDYSFSIVAGTSSFGFSVVGDDVVDRFLDNGSNACGTGSGNDPNACWEGLSITPSAIASRGDSNHPDGTETQLIFRAGVGANALPTPGSYRATTTITLIAL